MRVLTDEHVSPVVANTLQNEGIDAVTLYETPISGKDDPAVLEFANEHEAMILTSDLDFITKEFVDDTGHWGILFYEDQRISRSDSLGPQRAQRS